MRWTSSWWPYPVVLLWTFSSLRSKTGLDLKPISWLTILEATSGSEARPRARARRDVRRGHRPTSAWCPSGSATCVVVAHVESTSLILDLCDSVHIVSSPEKKCEAGDEWRTSHWETSGWCSSHLEMSGWNEMDECNHNREGTMNAEAMMTLPLSRGLRSIQVSHWLTQLQRVESSTSVRFRRPKRLSSTSLDPNRVSSLETTKQWALAARPRCWERLRCPSGMGGVECVVKYTVVDSPGVPPRTPVSLLKQVGAVI